MVEYGTPFTVVSSTGQRFFEGYVELENEHLVNWDQDYPRTYSPEKLSAGLVESEVRDGGR